MNLRDNIANAKVGDEFHVTDRYNQLMAINKRIKSPAKVLEIIKSDRCESGVMFKVLNVMNKEVCLDSNWFF